MGTAAVMRCGPAVAAVCIAAFALAAEAQYETTTIDFGTTGTFLTGIRGNNIVGNYTIPGNETAGLLYNLETGAFTQFPVPDGVSNYPGAIGSSPYGPSVGNPDGILRAVGSYKTTDSSPYDLGYISTNWAVGLRFDGEFAAGAQSYAGTGILRYSWN